MLRMCFVNRLMRFFINHIQRYLSAECALLRLKAHNTVITVVLFLMTSVLFVFAVGFGLFAIYSFLTEAWAPWQAGLLIAGILAALVAWLFLLIYKKPPLRPPKDTGVKLSSTSPENNETESALKLGEAVGQTVKRSKTEPTDLALAALLVGIVLGASPSLRGSHRRKNNECNKKDDP